MFHKNISESSFFKARPALVEHHAVAAEEQVRGRRVNGQGAASLTTEASMLRLPGLCVVSPERNLHIAVRVRLAGKRVYVETVETREAAHRHALCLGDFREGLLLACPHVHRHEAGGDAGAEILFQRALVRYGAAERIVPVE